MLYYFLALSLFFSFLNQDYAVSDQLRLASAQTFIILCTVWWLSRRAGYRHYLLILITLIMVADVPRLLLGYSPYFTGVTFDTAIMAILLPLAFHSPFIRWTTPFLAFAILYYGGVTSLLIVGVELLCFLDRKHLKFAALTTIAAGISIYFNREHIFVSEKMTRLYMWATYFDWWWANANHWWGIGPGAFSVIGPLIPVRNLSYVWMHCDWLQLLFDLGFINFAIVLAFSIFFLVRSWRYMEMRATIFGFYTCMCFYSPLRLFIMQLFVGVCLREVGMLEKKRAFLKFIKAKFRREILNGQEEKSSQEESI